MGLPDLRSGQKPPEVNFGEGRRAQLAKSTLLTSTLVPLGSFKVCSDAKERVGCTKQREATAPIQSLVKLQPWFLILQWKTCLWQNCSLGSCICSEAPALWQNTRMMMMIMILDVIGHIHFNQTIALKHPFQPFSLSTT